MRAISQINKPRIIKTKKESLEDFLLLVEYILQFASDNKEDYFLQIQNSHKENFKLKYYKYFEELESYLENNFFNKLYAERSERNKIILQIPSKRSILLIGPIGSGKSTILGKIKYDSNQILIIDFKAEIHILKNYSHENFQDKLDNFIYNYLYTTFIFTDDILVDWNFFTMQYDEGEEYQRFRQNIEQKTKKILHYSEKSIKSFKEQHHEISKKWKDLYNNNEIKKEFNDLYKKKKPVLITLINFIRTKFQFSCLVFDNIDRLHQPQQANAFVLGVDISNKGNIPVIISIRTTNVEYLKKCLGDSIKRQQVGEFFQKKDNIIGLHKITYDVLKNILYKRFVLLIKKEDSMFITKILAELRKDYKKFDFEKCKNNFWTIFEIINKTFVDQGIQEFCNHNLRGILLEYFKFISKIMLNAERPYRFFALTKLKIGDRRTKIKDYYFKFLTCGGETMPTDRYQIINIYEDLSIANQNLNILYIKILELLHNWKNRNNKNMTFKEIFDIFSHFGVKKSKMINHILRLSKVQEENDYIGFLSIEGPNNTSINDNDIIEIMPAGEYFLKELSISREYCFWISLNTELEEPILDKNINFNETYNTKLRFDVVINFIERILLPAFKKEMNYFISTLTHQNGWSYDNFENLKKFFTVKNKFYIQRLISSNNLSIDYSLLKEVERKSLEDKFKKLSSDINEFLENINKK